MKKNSQKNQGSEVDWAARYQDLAATCQLWIAANEAKDERIAEVEQQCQHLQQRVARLSRMVGRRGNTVRRISSNQPALRRSPTMA